MGSSCAEACRKDSLTAAERRGSQRGGTVFKGHQACGIAPRDRRRENGGLAHYRGVDAGSNGSRSCAKRADRLRKCCGGTRRIACVAAVNCSEAVCSAGGKASGQRGNSRDKACSSEWSGTVIEGHGTRRIASGDSGG